MSSLRFDSVKGAAACVDALTKGLVKTAHFWGRIYVKLQSMNKLINQLANASHSKSGKYNNGELKEKLEIALAS